MWDIRVEPGKYSTNVRLASKASASRAICPGELPRGPVPGPDPRAGAGAASAGAARPLTCLDTNGKTKKAIPLSLFQLSARTFVMWLDRLLAL